MNNFSCGHSHPEPDQGPVNQEEGGSDLLPMIIFSLLSIPSPPWTTQVIPLFNKYLFNTPFLPVPKPGPRALKRNKE